LDEGAINFMLSVVKGMEPRDQVEALLAAQMAAVHMATMSFARRLAHVGTIPQQDSAERALSMLARTYAQQVEVLKRYRTGGQQRVTVEQVTVNDGGQAIVGNVAQGGWRPLGIVGRPQEGGVCLPEGAVPHSNLKAKAHGPVLQGPSRARVDRVPFSRRLRRWAEGRAQRDVPARLLYEGGLGGAPPPFGDPPAGPAGAVHPVDEIPAAAAGPLSSRV